MLDLSSIIDAIGLAASIVGLYEFGTRILKKFKFPHGAAPSLLRSIATAVSPACSTTAQIEREYFIKPRIISPCRSRGRFAGGKVKQTSKKI